MVNVAIFASGSGTNAENIIGFFRKTNVQITKIYCNNEGAGVIEKAKTYNISTKIFTKDEFFSSDLIINDLKHDNVDFIILAGFLLLLPKELIQLYPQKIINIHPALLPKYGGKGMYGNHIHKAVLANNEKETGITVHLVDEIYDNGKIIFQARCSVTEDETVESLSEKVHDLEYEHFPPVIMAYITQQTEG